jgi:HEPN domain-containing protein/predicted nucleotidyltransferase
VTDKPALVFEDGLWDGRTRREWLPEVIEDIVAKVDPVRIILFGSRAKSSARPDSDIDLLVVMPEGTDRRKAMVQIASRIDRTDCGIDVLVATPAVLEAQADNPGLIYGQILRTGRDVYRVPGHRTSEPLPDYSAGDAGSPTAWLRHARADLSLAEAAPPDGVVLELLCFHAQQAAEKALKAVWILIAHEWPPRSHHLLYLLSMLREAGVSDPLPLEVEAAQQLTRYAVITRYPGDVGVMDEAEWQRAIADARAVVEWAERVIERSG